MTTNVFDRNVRLMATDSRWSLSYGPYLIYLDDSGFDKIEICGGYGFMFAGLGRQVQRWKAWLRSAPGSNAGQPDHNGMAVCMVRIADGQEMFCAGAQIRNDESVFAGTGSHSAYSCWAQNRDARKSVETAKLYDKFTGGDVKFFDLKTGNHNLVLGANITATDVQIQLGRRGLVMEIKSEPRSGAPFPLKDAVASNDVLAEASKKIVSGELQACAPCDQMHNQWSDDEKERFDQALGEAFGWKK
jgi:hypothetical protein